MHAMIRKPALIALLLGALTLTALPALAAPTARVAQLYQSHCSVCHGDHGDGHSRAAADMVPRPRDFTAPQAAVELTRARMIRSIREGRPGTAMAGWKTQLSDRQIGDLADYIRERFMVPTAYDTSSEGRRVYAEYCSVCHGDKGNGDSRAARSLDPHPRDFTSPSAREELSRERMMFSVTYGRANTAMAAWGSQLKEGQIVAVVDYIRTSFMGLSPGAEAPAMAHRPQDGASHGAGHNHAEHRHVVPGRDLAAFFTEPFPQGLKGRSAEGESLYRGNCVPCHGAKGDGNGPRAFFILPRPRDFGHPAARASLNRPHLYEGIAKGVLRSEMPAWQTVLSPQQIADVAEYVLTEFIRPPAAARPAPHHHVHAAGAEHQHDKHEHGAAH